MCIKVKFKDQDAYEARFRALQIVDERAAVKSVNGVLPDDAGAITLTPANINAVSVEEFNALNGIIYIAVAATDDAISTVNGETYADIQALINAGKPVVVRYEDVLDFYYFETFEFSDSSGIHKRLNFRCVMGSIVYTLTLRDDNTWAITQTSLQTSSITDTGGHFTSDTVEGALQEIGAELAGINTLLGSGEITS